MLLKPDHCRTCVLYGNGRGYVPSEGEGKNGVLVVLEAAGAAEEECGRPTVGKAGYFLWQNLARIGLEREQFRIHNVLSCRPPENKLANMSWEDDAIEHCSPLLDATINDHKEKSLQRGLTPTILALGNIAVKRLLGINHKNPILRYDYHSYPFWLERYGCWLISSYHPAFLMRGNAHLLPVLQYAAIRATEIAANGLTLHNPVYLKDPGANTFNQWVKDYLDYSSNHESYLAYDIETPYKQGKD